MSRYDEIRAQYQSMSDLQVVYHRHQALYCHGGTPDKMECEIAELEYQDRAKNRNRTVNSSITVPVIPNFTEESRRTVKSEPKFRRSKFKRKR